MPLQLLRIHPSNEMQLLIIIPACNFLIPWVSSRTGLAMFFGRFSRRVKDKMKHKVPMIEMNQVGLVGGIFPVCRFSGWLHPYDLRYWCDIFLYIPVDGKKTDEVNFFPVRTIVFYINKNVLVFIEWRTQLRGNFPAHLPPWYWFLHPVSFFKTPNQTGIRISIFTAVPEKR